ncbi:MAG: histidine--tRNA ligase [Bacteroidota bacterium]
MSLLPSLPAGMRDFGPEVMARRTYMCDVIRQVFIKYGFWPMETPAMEKVTTLTDKYGEEGEQLIFRVLNSGDFLKGVDRLDGMDHSTLRKSIAEKGLRYDLTVPLARYVAQHRHQITWPFKRSQIQPVWRADRPQKGRFREFYQCDADVVGGGSLFYESEMLAMIQEVFETLGLDDYVIELNHRLIFKALAQKLSIPAQELLLCTVLDKLDKIGWAKVEAMLQDQGLSSEKVKILREVLEGSEDAGNSALATLEKHLGEKEVGKKAVEDLREVFEYMHQSGHPIDKINLTPTLARGMAYYTGTIFEVKVAASADIGSVAAGGRYDELIGAIFGKESLPCLGLSFGLERLYEVLLAKQRFPENLLPTSHLLFAPITKAQEAQAIQGLASVRKQAIRATIYLEKAKLKKMLSYANKKNIPFVAIIGTEETPGHCTLKDMRTGKQIVCTFDTVAKTIKNNT